MDQILYYAGYGVYGALALAALYGTFCVILLVKRIGQKRFPSLASADEFFDEVRERLQKKRF